MANFCAFHVSCQCSTYRNLKYVLDGVMDVLRRRVADSETNHGSVVGGSSEIEEWYVRWFSLARVGGLGAFHFLFSLFAVASLIRSQPPPPPPGKIRRLRLVGATREWREPSAATGTVARGSTRVGLGPGVGLGLASRLGERSITCEAGGWREGGRGKSEEPRVYGGGHASIPRRVHVSAHLPTYICKTGIGECVGREKFREIAQPKARVRIQRLFLFLLPILFD